MIGETGEIGESGESGEIREIRENRARREHADEAERIAARLRALPRHGGTAPRAVLAVAMLLLTLVGLGWLTLAREDIAAQVSSPMAAKLASADRINYYVVDELQGPRFRLAPNDRSLKLITHLVLPEGSVYDETAEFSYSIELRLTTLEDELIWQQTIDIGTRQSKAEGTEHGWRFENSFMVGDARELTDDRLTRIRLPPGDEDRLLSLRLIPDVPASQVVGLARVYVHRPRPADNRKLRSLQLAPEQRQELVGGLTYRGWEQLTEDERRSKLRWVWERLAAVGESNRDYSALAVWETGFRLPRELIGEQARLRVTPMRSLAFNVVGPAELGLHSSLASDLARPGELHVTRIDLEGSSERLLDAGAGEHTLRVPEGVHTLVLEADSAMSVELEVVETDTDPTRLSDRPKRISESGSELLEPDVRAIPMVWLHRLRGPASTGDADDPRPAGPIYTVPEQGDLASRVLRFDVRVVAEFADWWPKVSNPPALELRFLDSSGNELSRTRWEGDPPVRSRFEGRRAGGPREAEARWYAVSEPQSLRTIVPSGATQVELRSTDSLLIRGYGYWPEVPTRLAEPWSTATHERTRWRYPVLDTRTWFPILPSNFRELERHAMTSEVLAQVRLQPLELGAPEGPTPTGEWLIAQLLGGDRSGEEGFDPGPWTSVDPLGRHRRRSLLEQLDDDADRRLRGRWTSGLFSELQLGRSFTIDLGAVGPAAPELHWQTEPDLLGRNLLITIDGHTTKHRLTSTRGRMRLSERSGWRRVEVELDSPSRRSAGEDGSGKRERLRAWIDRPILVGEHPVARRRTVHELTSRSLVIPIDKPGPEALVVNVVVYVPRMTERVELHTLLDDGAVERRSGVALEQISEVDHHYRLDARGLFDEHEQQVDRRRAIRFVDLEGEQGAPLDVVSLPVVLGEDIAPGRHEVRVTIDAGRVWIRAFHRGAGDRSKPAVSWTETLPASVDGLREGD